MLPLGISQALSTAPLGEVLLYPHALQLAEVVDAVVGLYVPAGHCAQVPFSAVSLYVPDRHCWQFVPSSMDAHPALQVQTLPVKEPPFDGSVS